MTQHPDAKVFIVDDDAGVRDALAWLLRTRRLLSERYDSADAFLAEIARWSSEPAVPCCLLLDVRMPGTSGLALFEQLQVWAYKSNVDFGYKLTDAIHLGPVITEATTKK